MPLLVMTGFPASGKSTIASRILEEFNKRGFERISIVDDESFGKQFYGDFKKEKEHRGTLRSTIQRLLSKEHLVICDSLNYIKGFRYELFCVGKSVETTYAMLYCKTTLSTSLHLNNNIEETKRYPIRALEDLTRRYEKPEAKNRWDSPLFEVLVGGIEESKEEDPFLVEDFETEIEFGNKQTSTQDSVLREDLLPRNVQLPFDELYQHLIEGKNLKANLSTQNLTPNTSSNFLYELDCVTQNIITKLICLQNSAVPGDKLLLIDDGDVSDKNKVNFHRARTLAELTRLRKQFISYTKMHPVKDLNIIASLFVDFLNSSP